MLNKVIIMGNLVADPEHKQTQSGVSFVNIRVAVSRNFADQNGNRETDFINVIAWRHTADFICRHFTKGKMICVEGSIRTGSYDDKNTGAKRYTTDIQAEQVYFAGPNPNGNQGGYNNNFPIPEPPPERPSDNYGDNGGYQNSNNNSNYNPNQNDYGNSNGNNNNNANNNNNQSSGFSVGDFTDATDDDDDDFPY